MRAKCELLVRKIFVSIKRPARWQARFKRLSERITEVSVYRIVHVIFPERRFFQLQAKTHIILNFRIHPHIHQHSAVLFTFKTFLSGCIPQNRFSVRQQVELVTQPGSRGNFPVVSGEGSSHVNTGTANQWVRVEFYSKEISHDFWTYRAA